MPFLPRRRPTGARMLVAAIAFAVTAAFRFLATQGFSNDHFVHLAGAQQILFGDWPTRDFLDPGLPLMFLASAAAQVLLGHSLFSEAVLVSVAFGFAAAFTVLVVESFTGSLLLGVGAAALEVAVWPHAYGYPKILVTAAGLWCIGRMLREPGVARLVAMAACVCVGFLFRHDLGFYVGVGALVAALMGTPDHTEARWRNGLSLVALVLIMVTPYLLYVQWASGLWDYFSAGVALSQAENVHAWLNPFAADATSASRLMYVIYLMPIAALAVAASDVARHRHDWRSSFLVAAAALALVENIGLVRDLPEGRVPDAIVPAVVLGACLLGRLPRTYAGRLVLVPVLGLYLLAGSWVWDLGSMRQQLDRAGMRREGALAKLPGLFGERAAELRERFAARQIPSHAVMELIPFFSYLDRCSLDDDRLFLIHLPEVAYFANRPFGGGAFDVFYYLPPEHQRRVVDWLRRRRTPFALLRTDYAHVFDQLDIVPPYIHGRYVPMTEVPVDDWRIQILVDRTLPSTGVDSQTGWPCFRSPVERGGT